MKKIIFLALIAITLASCRKVAPIPVMDYTYMSYFIVAVDEDGYDLFSTNRPNAINYLDLRYDMYDATGAAIVTDGNYSEKGPNNHQDLIIQLENGLKVSCRAWVFSVERDPYINYKIVIKWDKNTADEITFIDSQPQWLPIMKVNGVETSSLSNKATNNSPVLVHVFPAMPKDEQTSESIEMPQKQL